MEAAKPKTIQDLKKTKLYSSVNTVAFLMLILTIPATFIVWIWFDFTLAFKTFLTGLVVYVSAVMLLSFLKEVFKLIVESKKKEEPAAKSKWQQEIEDALKKKNNKVSEESENSDELLEKEANSFLKEYENLHKCCPKCGSEIHVATEAYYHLDLSQKENYKDLNRCECYTCGDIHTVHDRIPG